MMEALLFCDKKHHNIKRIIFSATNKNCVSAFHYDMKAYNLCWCMHIIDKRADYYKGWVCWIFGGPWTNLIWRSLLADNCIVFYEKRINECHLSAYGGGLWVCGCIKCACRPVPGAELWKWSSFDLVWSCHLGKWLHSGPVSHMSSYGQSNTWLKSQPGRRERGGGEGRVRECGEGKERGGVCVCSLNLKSLVYWASFKPTWNVSWSRKEKKALEEHYLCII